jgi:hypothetical protein
LVTVLYAQMLSLRACIFHNTYCKGIQILFFIVIKFFFIVYPDGRVCISILHAPGDDPMGYETSAERWSPVQSVEKILLSVVSMLAGTVKSLYR